VTAIACPLVDGVPGVTVQCAEGGVPDQVAELGHEPFRRVTFQRGGSSGKNFGPKRSLGWEMRTLVSRRSIGVCLAVLAVGLVASGCDWTQFGYGSGHDGYSPDSTITPANVSSLALQFTLSTGAGGDITGEAEANGVLYVVFYPSTASPVTLDAFSANGTTGCSGTPVTCNPLWSASLGVASNGLSSSSKIAVDNGVVYVGGGPGLEAFDANGQTNCAGTPTVCQPLWQASVDWNYGTPTVSQGSVYVTSGGSVEAFDASGKTNCTGSPTVCSPLWTAPVSAESSTVTVGGGKAYVGSSAGGPNGSIVALSATGTSGCSGTPTVCSPLWQYTLNQVASQPYVTQSGSTIYVGTLDEVSAFDFTGSVEAFDANGVTNCSGTPTVCSPLWTDSNYASGGPPLVGDGAVFASPWTGIGSPLIDVFNTSGNELWTTSIGVSPLAIGGSVLYAENQNNVYAFDATGQSGCSDSVCSPLWSTGLPTGGSTDVGPTIVANGSLYVATASYPTGDAEVLAYGLS
jgi:hypothetical protein